MIRIDELALVRGFATNLDEAKRLCIAGKLKSSDVAISNPSQKVKDDIDLRLADVSRFASRGGEKLQGALKAFELNVESLSCLDVGASSGGFTDCLLLNGAASVVAIDLAYGQFDYRLREDSRVRLYERLNIRDAEEILGGERFDLIVCDLSFTTLRGMLEVLGSFMKSDANILALIKPQFELPKEDVKDGGVVCDHALHKKAKELVLQSLSKHNLSSLGIVESPIKGTNGNTEFFILLRNRLDSV